MTTKTIQKTKKYKIQNKDEEEEEAFKEKQSINTK